MKILLLIGGFALFTFSFSSCHPTAKSKKNNIETKGSDSLSLHNSQNSLDWAGYYQGVMPCADCEGIQTSITLNKDQTYSYKSKYINQSDSVFESTGTFTWNSAGNEITLKGEADSLQTFKYKVGENMLTQLDLQGNMIEGNLAKQYTLYKQQDDLTEKYWKLIELNGQKIIVDENTRREPHIIFKNADNRVIGSGGCNNLTGSYELKRNNRISISNVASTKMACAHMDIEAQFFRALEMTDSYYMQQDTLQLNKARMAPLAKLVAVYLK